MYPSANRHVLSILRKTLGSMKQWQLAELAGCSVETIRKIEKGRIGLSENLARRISVATGVDLEWLVENNLTKPPTSRFARRYDKHFYDAWSTVRSVPLPAALAEYLPDHLLTIYVAMRGVVTAAAAKGERYAMYALAELQRPIAQLFEEFGSTSTEDATSPGLQISPSQLAVVERDVSAARVHIENAHPLFKGDRTDALVSKAELPSA